MKAIPAGTDALDSELESVYPGAEALLLDSVDNGKFGGTGRSFDFSKYPTGIGRNVFLAGGLGVDNVQEAIRVASPYGVDASSRLESEPGIKNHELVTFFVKTVRDTDRAGED